ncbi:fungal-specific transcription factor domain-containing protein [Aspergillus cavernicola]|uniref:Fungal-specific transcription factor domain-containing protein n=1 Tax=Aspergillus cavernicola TaxID=176166 RepID=A0ABR4HYQ9_9EURO
MLTDSLSLDRRILCDRALPTCTQCTRANRACKGYGIRLSWPKASNARRAMIGGLRGRSAGRRISDSLVNTSSWDIEMHYYLLGLLPDDYTPPALRVPMPFTPVRFDDAESQLFQYFQSTASRSLATLDHDPVSLGNTLMRMAISSTSPSAAAVWQALLALSSLHRYGVQSRAFEFKIQSIRALAVASNSDIGATEAIQHIAAGMILCSFEIHKATCTSGQWRQYITGVKQVIAASSLERFREDTEFSALLDWVYYHDALSRFSSLHWRDAPFPAGAWPETECQPLFAEIITDHTPILRSTPSTLNILLRLLSEGCEMLSNRPTTTSPTALIQYKTSMKILSKRLKALPFPNSPSPTLQLFYHATLIYFNRATSNLLEPASKTQLRISQGFTLLSSLDSCERHFPLFILGCESRTDEDRCMILDLIARTERTGASRSLTLTRIFMEHVWVQDDLAIGKLDYAKTLSAVIGSCAILPTFV